MSPHRHELPIRESATEATLRALLIDPVDVGYHPGAARQERSIVRRAVSVIVIAFLVACAIWAARDLRGATSGTEALNEGLYNQVGDRTTVQQALEYEVTNLTAQRDELRGGITLSDPAAEERSVLLGAAAGFLPVQGPGIVVTLDDSAATDADMRVRDFDLQVVVNALWFAGAEAISVNGERLAPSSAVRSAGEAVLVNLVPIAPPYVIEAIGDPTDLQVWLAQSRAAGHIAMLRDTLSVGVNIEVKDSLELAAASSQQLRNAQPLGVVNGEAVF